MLVSPLFSTASRDRLKVQLIKVRVSLAAFDVRQAPKIPEPLLHYTLCRFSVKIRKYATDCSQVLENPGCNEIRASGTRSFAESVSRDSDPGQRALTKYWTRFSFDAVLRATYTSLEDHVIL